MADKKVTLKSEMEVERIGFHKKRFRAVLGNWGLGFGNTEAAAKADCERYAIDVLQNMQNPVIEIREGYLIVSQVESSHNAWYTIKDLNELKPGIVHPMHFLDPKDLKQAIASHLAQYVADRNLYTNVG